MPAKCAQCGATSDRVRLYRSYGTFRRPEADSCNACLPTNESFVDNSFMVPLILNTDGDAYGFSSAPVWWRIHGEAIKAVIRCVMSKAKKEIKNDNDSV